LTWKWGEIWYLDGFQDGLSANQLDEMDVIITRLCPELGAVDGIFEGRKIVTAEN